MSLTTAQGPSSIRPSSFRDSFLLDPAVAFLNHGSFGATPRAVFADYQEWQQRLERQPVEFLGRQFTTLLATARVALARYVNAAADDLVFEPNATTALNIVARSLRLAPGDEVLATDHEYGAMDRLWRYICHQTGARYIRQPIPVPVASAHEVVESVWSGVTPRTRVLFLSHVTSPTALILPVGELCRRARAAGIMSIVDGAHALGQFALNITELDADAYAANAHKWLCAPKGAAFLHVRREFQPKIQPLVVSWGYEAITPSASRFLDEQQWTGTRDIAAFLAVPAAIAFCTSPAWQSAQTDCHVLLRSARNRLTESFGMKPLCPDSAEWFRQMTALQLPPCDGASLQSRLYQRHRVEVPIFEWQGRQLLRLSVQAYNSTADIDRLVAGLTEELTG
jgi:isopenicillin-N epimerase